VETIVRRCIWPIALRQIAPRHPGAQHVKDRVHDRAIVSAAALAALRHQRLEKSPFVVAQIKSHDPPPRTVNHVRSNYSIRYLGTDASRNRTTTDRASHVDREPYPQSASEIEPHHRDA